MIKIENTVIAMGHAKTTFSFMKGWCIIMKPYKSYTRYKIKYTIKRIAMIVFRILLTPIFVWYRLYLWVWDGTMFDR